MTKEQKYKEQMQKLGIYEEIFDPEISTLAQLERELQRAKKEWSRKAEKGAAPSVLEDIYFVIQKMRAEILQHRDALGLTPKGLHRLRGVQAGDSPDQKDLIAAKLDKIAESVAGAGFQDVDLDELLGPADAYANMPGFQEAQQISDQMDHEDYDLKQAVAEDMG